jgi:hypothetical protein
LVHEIDKSSVKHPGTLTSKFNPTSGGFKATQTMLLQASVEQDSSSSVKLKLALWILIKNLGWMYVTYAQQRDQQ